MMLGSLEGLTGNGGQDLGAGMAVEDVQMDETSMWLGADGLSPTHQGAQIFEISTRSEKSRRGHHGRTRRWRRREIDDLKAAVNKHTKRQVLVDSFHEELDQLSKQITGVTLENPRRRRLLTSLMRLFRGMICPRSRALRSGMRKSETSWRLSRKLRTRRTSSWSVLEKKSRTRLMLGPQTSLLGQRRL